MEDDARSDIMLILKLTFCWFFIWFFSGFFDALFPGRLQPEFTASLVVLLDLASRGLSEAWRRFLRWRYGE